FTLLLVIARGGMDDLFAIPPRPAAPDLSIVDPKLVAGMTARIAGDRSRAITAALANRVTEAMTARRLWQREGLGIAQLAAALRRDTNAISQPAPRDVRGRAGWKSCRDARGQLTTAIRFRNQPHSVWKRRAQRCGHGHCRRSFFVRSPNVVLLVSRLLIAVLI